MKLTLGRGDCQPFVERCLKLSKWGENTEYKLYPADPQFLPTAAWNGYDELIKDKLALKDNPLKYYIKLELEICKVAPAVDPERKSIFEMSTEEKRLLAESQKKLGDDEFRSQNFEAALEFYTKAFKVVFFEDGEVFNDLKFRIGSNLAFVNLKLKKYEACINMNDQLIRFGYNISDKIFFRNGQAAQLYGRFEEAIKYYEKARDMAKDEEQKKLAIQSIAAVEKQISDKKGSMIKNMQKMWGS